MHRAAAAAAACGELATKKKRKAFLQRSDLHENRERRRFDFPLSFSFFSAMRVRRKEEERVKARKEERKKERNCEAEEE